LAKKISITIEERTLPEAAEDFSRTTKIPLRLDDKIEGGSLSEQSFSGEFKNVSARSVMLHVCRHFGVTSVETDSGILLTQDSVNLPVRMYDIRDLLKHRGALWPEQNYKEDILALIQEISSETWEEVGGVGKVSLFRGQLVVCHEHEIHTQVESLLRAIRTARRFAESFDDEFSAYVYGEAIRVGDSPGELRAYPIADLIGRSIKPDRFGEFNAKESPDSIVNIIENTIDSGSWDAFGGPGTIIGPLFDVIVVRQSRANHELIQELVEPDSWEAADVMAKTLPGRIIIRQPDSAHLKIRELLIGLQVFRGATPGYTSGDSPTGPRSYGFRGGGFGGGGSFSIPTGSGR
jgi:hypothetical protein